MREEFTFLVTKNNDDRSRSSAATDRQGDKPSRACSRDEMMKTLGLNWRGTLESRGIRDVEDEIVPERSTM